MWRARACSVARARPATVCAMILLMVMLGPLLTWAASHAPTRLGTDPHMLQLHQTLPPMWQRYCKAPELSACQGDAHTRTKLMAMDTSCCTSVVGLLDLYGFSSWVWLAGIGRRNTGLPPHLLEAASRRKLAREGPGKNHDSSEQIVAHAQSNGKIPAKHDILDTQPDINSHDNPGHGIMDSHTNYNSTAPGQAGVLDSHKPSSAVAGDNGGTDGEQAPRSCLLDAPCTCSIATSSSSIKGSDGHGPNGS